jgi:hypothetical protein
LGAPVPASFSSLSTPTFARKQEHTFSLHIACPPTGKLRLAPMSPKQGREMRKIAEQSSRQRRCRMLRRKGAFSCEARHISAACKLLLWVSVLTRGKISCRCPTLSSRVLHMPPQPREERESFHRQQELFCRVHPSRGHHHLFHPHIAPVQHWLFPYLHHTFSRETETVFVFLFLRFGECLTDTAYDSRTIATTTRSTRLIQLVTRKNDYGGRGIYDCGEGKQALRPWQSRYARLFSIRIAFT